MANVHSATCMSSGLAAVSPNASFRSFLWPQQIPCTVGVLQRTIRASAAPRPGNPPTTTVNLSAFVARDNGPPRLVCPLSDAQVSQDPRDPTCVPLMIYLPGIDGTGLAAARQFPRLMERFNLVTLIVPPSDRSDFTHLVAVVVDFLEQEVPCHPPTRPVYLLGESFGGLVALAVAAAAPHLVDRLVLVNPATSFEESVWSLLGPLLLQVPEGAYSALPVALAPILGNPINLLAAAAEGAGADATLEERMTAVVAGAARLLAQLPLLAELLPPDTLAWKLELLREGCAAVVDSLRTVPQRTLIIVGDADMLIPSADEGPRLRRALPRAHLRVERGRSHALLQEGGVDLVRILEEEGAYVAVRRMSSHTAARVRTASGSGFGSASPIELPTEVELKRYGARTTALGRRLASPIFFSTSADGKITKGLGHVPSRPAWSSLDPDASIGLSFQGQGGKGPVLYVGNHQTMALDLGVLCEEFLKEKDVMLRGLAHPVIFGGQFGQNKLEDEQQGSSIKADAKNAAGRQRPGLSPFDIIPTFGELLNGQQDGSMFSLPLLPQRLLSGFGQERKRQQEPADGQAAFAEFMIEFGAVPVSARNFARLMQNGESVLLFPGGVREAYKKRNEEYRLFWPRRAEFVRMAAKYGATIVPFAAVGVDDSLDVVLDSDDLRRVPVLGEIISNRAAALPRARRGTAAAVDEEPESFVSPLVVPKLPPRRMYFLFQAPLYPGERELKEREKCDGMYAEVKASVEAGLQYLLLQRERDPYKDFGRRVLYEVARSGKQAPTFTF